VTKGDNKKEISSFKWSPNGQHIAFISPDEKSTDQEAKEKETDDAKVYGKGWEYNRLRLLHVGTREVATLVTADVHVTDFAWSEDSKEVVSVTQKTPDMNSAGYNGVLFSRVSLASKNNEVIGEERFPGPAHDLAWSGEDLFFLTGATPSMSNTSSCVYKLLLVSDAWKKYAHGDEDCVYSLRSIAWNTRRAVVLHVLAGLTGRITCIRYEDSEDQNISSHGIHELETWDTAIGPIPNENTIQVVGYSTASKPTEIYSFRKKQLLLTVKPRTSSREV
jgi:dipeptidyl aminopeptidase/acylaminoacyl peptidase